MANPQKDKKSGVYYFKVRVPADLVSVLGFKKYSTSLCTKDPVAARRLFKEMERQKDREHDLLRSKPAPLTHKHIVALAGKAYRELMDMLEEEPGSTGVWHEVLLLLGRVADNGNLEKWFGPTIDKILLEDGSRTDQQSRARLLEETHKAALQASEQQLKRAEGDYSPDPRGNRFPELARGSTDQKQVTITSLYELWKRDHLANDKAASTATEYDAKVKHFIAWLKHDDALRVTKGDIAAYCDHLRHDTGLSAKTINGKYLTCIKAIYRKGFDRDLITNNVAAATRYSVPKAVVVRDKGYTDEEATAILKVANRSMLPPEDGSRERRSLANRLAGRWVPWLCCYTGARVAEITQLRKQDISQQYEIDCLRITPEAGSVKTGIYRVVPIHPHLISMGFLDFVQSQPDGPLFYEAKTDRKEGTNTPAQWAGNALARWIKGELGDAMPKVQPNHAWRHRFKTVGRDAGLDLHYLNVIQGHSEGKAATDYGKTTVKALYREICKVPKVVIDAN